METRNARGNRAVITGVGLLIPVGKDAPTAWQALLDGKSGAGPIKNFDTTGFDVRFAAEVNDFDPTSVMERKEAKRMDRFAQFAMAAAVEAMNTSGLANSLDTLNRDRIGVLIASGIGGITTFEEQARIMVEKGPRRISPFFIPMFIPDIASGHVSMRYGL